MTIKTPSVFFPVLAFVMALGGTGFETSSAQQAVPSAPSATGVVYHDLNGNGLRDPGEKGRAGVCVSNGGEVVPTDAEGRYRLPAGVDTVIFVIKPAGWMTPLDEHHLPRFYYLHKPAGSPPLKYPGVAPTGPLPDSIDFPLYRRDEPRRFRVVLFGDTQPDSQKDLDYLAHDMVEELIGAQAAFGVSLGDLVNNDLSLFESLVQTVGLIGLPWYNVLGNHDMNYDVPDDRHSDESFERVFGPPYYSFDYGPVHFLVLDNVIWHGPPNVAKGGYHGGLGDRQLQFIRNDLARVPPEKLVVLTMHIPLTEVEDRHELFRILEQRPHTLSLSAHWHIQRHFFLSSADGWNGPRPHHHLVQATACGSWWTGAPDELGLPHTTMRDGTPNGYAFVTFDGHRYSIEYKAARRPADYQMNIHAPEQVSADQAQRTEVLVNVFAGSPHSTVEMRFGPTGPWAKLDRIERPDPGYARLLKLESKLPQPPWEPLPQKTLDCPHLWQGRLPADPPVGTHLFHVRTTDMFGHTYTARRIIRITPDPDSVR